MAFRVIVGDADGHGKNYSVCLDDGLVTLSPLYDSLCTLAYPELTQTMGAPVGQQQTLAKTDRSALLEEAVALGIPAADADVLLVDLANGIAAALTDLPATITSGWDSAKVTGLIAERAGRVLSGRPLGDRETESPRRRPTLDELSR